MPPVDEVATHDPYAPWYGDESDQGAPAEPATSALAVQVPVEPPSPETPAEDYAAWYGEAAPAPALEPHRPARARPRPAAYHQQPIDTDGASADPLTGPFPTSPLERTGPPPAPAERTGGHAPAGTGAHRTAAGTTAERTGGFEPGADPGARRRAASAPTGALPVTSATGAATGAVPAVRPERTGAHPVAGGSVTGSFRRAGADGTGAHPTPSGTERAAGQRTGSHRVSRDTRDRTGTHAAVASAPASATGSVTGSVTASATGSHRAGESATGAHHRGQSRAQAKADRTGTQAAVTAAVAAPPAAATGSVATQVASQTGTVERIEEALTGPIPGVDGVDPFTQPFTALTAPVGVLAPAQPAVPKAAPAPPVPRRSRHLANGGPPRRTAVRATVLAVILVLLGGGASALAMDKTITITVDGHDRTLHTFASTVASALASAGIAPGPQDRVQPALPTDLADGDQVIFNQARKLTLVEGSSQREVWTTEASVGEALQVLGVEAAPDQMSATPDAAIPFEGISLELTMPRNVSLTDATGVPTPIITTSGTVAGLLAERGVQLGPDDVAIPSDDTALTEGMSVQVVRNGVGEVVETRPIPPPEQVIEDPDMARGEREVVERGRPGEQTAIMRVWVQNGQEVRREQVRAGGITQPLPRVVRVGTNDDIRSAPYVSDGSVWDRLARCESTGNWEISSGNGYYGGLQFDAGTWRAYDGTDYAPLPHQASRDEQIAVATKVRDDRGGYGAWPACSRKLGLPQ